jgi:hopene-associated glycosyltransferase HpnB
MSLVLIAMAALSFAAWIYLFFFHAAFWQMSSALAPRAEFPTLSRPLAVVVPARDEAAVIGASLASLFAIARQIPVHIFCVDDSSSDGTAERAREAARAAEMEDRLTIIPAPPVPAGWTGKLWALQQGIAPARAMNPEFFLFTDADIVHDPADLAALIGLAQQGNYDLASLMVRLHCAGFPEKLLVPAFLFFFFKLYPPRRIRNPRRRTAGAAGGCVLIRPQALERAGGLQAICGEIIDDCALSRAVKKSGGKIWLGLARESRSTRAYGSFREFGRMISRTAFRQLHHSSLLLAAAVTGLIVIYLLPIALLFSRNVASITLATIAWLLMTVAYLPVLRFYRLSPLWALSLPIAALFYMGATMNSALNFWLGRGGAWKGRVQDRSRASAAQ